MSAVEGVQLAPRSDSMVSTHDRQCHLLHTHGTYNINSNACLTAIFRYNPGKPVPECRHSGLHWRKDDIDRCGGDNWSIEPTPNFSGRMPFLSPNQQCQSTEGKKCLIARTCSPQTHLRVFQHCPWTTKGSWSPWGRLVKPPVSL